MPLRKVMIKLNKLILKKSHHLNYILTVTEFKELLKESLIYLLEYVLGLLGPIKIVNGNIVIIEDM